MKPIDYMDWTREKIKTKKVKFEIITRWYSVVPSSFLLDLLSCIFFAKSNRKFHLKTLIQTFTPHREKQLKITTSTIIKKENK